MKGHFAKLALGNITENPTDYGSPVDGRHGRPGPQGQLQCRPGETGLFLAPVGVPAAHGQEFMWCSPPCNATVKCSTDQPAGGTATPDCGVGARNCILKCTTDKDCGGGAVCAYDSPKGLGYFCAFPLGDPQAGRV